MCKKAKEQKIQQLYRINTWYLWDKMSDTIQIAGFFWMIESVKVIIWFHTAKENWFILLFSLKHMTIWQ